MDRARTKQTAPKHNGEAREERTGPPIIRLEELAGPAAYVEIDGRQYRMASISSFGLIERTRIGAILSRADALEKLKRPTAEDAREYEERLRELAPIALPDAPAEILAKLSVGALSELAMAFFAQLAPNLRQRMVLLERMGRPTGTTSSPASSAPTAATREPGS